MLYVDCASFDKEFLLVSVNGYIRKVVVLCVVEKQERSWQDGRSNRNKPYEEFGIHKR